MNKRITLIAPLVILLAACGSDVNSDQNISNNKAQKITKKEIAQSRMEHSKKMVKSTTPSYKSVILNNQKFKLLTQEAVKGGKVFNFSTKENGIIKGSIIVVTKSFISISAVDSKTIAKDTYRLIPDDEKSLQELYKSLVNDEKYSVVELEIDYSPISTAPTM